MFIGEIIIIIFLLILSAIFSMIEASFLSVSAIKVHAFVHEKRPGAQALARLKQEPQRLIISMLAANTLVNFTAVTIAGVMLMRVNANYGMWVATILMTLVVLLFSQVTPKIIAEKNADKLSLFFAGSAETFTRIFFPIVILIEKFAFKVAEKFVTKNSTAISEEEFESMVTIGRHDGILSTQSAEIMRNVLTFQNTSLEHIMTPKPNVITISADTKICETIEKFLKHDKKYIPVFGKTDTQIVGIVSVADVLKAVKDKKTNTQIKNIMQEAFIVPETKDIQDLLYELETKKAAMAIVVNEYGSFVGLVTVHDILKLIVGKGDTEYTINKRHRRTKLFTGKTTLDQFNEYFSAKITDEKIKTLAGIVERELQHIPQKGEKLQYKGFTFEIIKATKQEIQEIRATKN